MNSVNLIPSGSEFTPLPCQDDVDGVLIRERKLWMLSNKLKNSIGNTLPPPLFKIDD